jgi:hypothetical protein
MGSYVLYLLMQAFVALVFAYFSGTLVFKERRPYMMLVSVGFYLLMGSALLEVWGDRGGYEAWAIGLNAALVATAVALMGAGALLRESVHMDDPETMERLSWALVVASAVMGAVLAAGSGSSSSFVDATDALTVEISGAFSLLGPAGWALGTPLFAGAALLTWLGIRGGLVRQELRTLWLLGAGVLFLLWPFNIHFLGVPLSPSLMMMGITMAFFGFQLPKADDGEGEAVGEGGGDAGEDAPPDDDGTDAGERREHGDDDEEPSPWVKEIIEARAEKGGSEDVEEE